MFKPPMSEDVKTIPDVPGSARPGEVLLVVGNDQLITHRIIGGEVVIGRSSECDLVLDHRALSRRHAVLRRAPTLTVQDLGSTNGVRLGGHTRRGGEPSPLTAGESFHIGPFSFLVVDAEVADPSTDRSGRDRLLVDDPRVEGVSALVAEIARSAVNILVQGETGVGKEVLASTLHQLSGRAGPLSSINCAVLSESLLESELFGHEKGAFTGAAMLKEGLLEAAAGGTIFLDEVGELPLSLQAKLLRAVESREVRRIGSTRSIPIDVRIIAATNRDLAAEAAAGRFRQDLFFRLDGVSLRIPPLRERKHAIGGLALHFIDEAARRFDRPGVRATPELLVALTAHDWPGNVRELKAVIERAVLLSRGSQLGSRHLAFAADTTTTKASPPPPQRARKVVDISEEDLDFLDDKQRADRARVVAALEECVGNQTRAAKLLGIARTTLVNKLSAYRIPRPRT
ncbi:MAG: sigma 54-interacting transcriptional regulator [Deltaproteobacteria bacterium]|nr:sigma 54-interacting transcriptional regulator [Deltaproteobacteria bacterium]